MSAIHKNILIQYNPKGKLNRLGTTPRKVKVTSSNLLFSFPLRLITYQEKKKKRISLIVPINGKQFGQVRIIST